MLLKFYPENLNNFRDIFDIIRSYNSTKVIQINQTFFNISTHIDRKNMNDDYISIYICGSTIKNNKLLEDLLVRVFKQIRSEGKVPIQSIIRNVKNRLG